MDSIREHRPSLRFPAAVQQLAARLEERAAAPLFAVGGTVRDALLGLPVDDWDLATAAPAELVAALLDEIAGDAPVVEEDRSLGTVGRRIDGIDAVVSTFRVESDYGPDRRPRALRFVATPQQDAARRDFTCNAIYLPVLAEGGGLIDPVGGIADLRAGVLRVVGEPLPRLREDPVRILRAARFVARFGLAMAASTERALRDAGPTVAGLSAYRLRTELELLFAGPCPARGLEVLAAAGVLVAALPEVIPDEDDRAPTGLWPGGNLPGALPPELAWPLWIHGGMPPVSGSASGPVAGAAARLERLLRRLDCGRAVAQRAQAVLAVVDELARRGAGGDLEVPDPVRSHWPELSGMVDALATALGEPRMAELWRGWAARCAAAAARAKAVEALLGGDDLLALGVVPGPDLGRLLGVVRARLLREQVTARDDALRLARAEVERHRAE